MNDTPETTLLSMFWSAHIVVKIVMLGLLAASFWSWTIIVNKTLLFRRFRTEMDSFEQVFWSGQSLERNFYGTLSQKPNAGAATLFVSAMREWKRSFQSTASSIRGLHARIDKVLDVSIAREVERLESNLLFLATVASAGPFVGLFGTVWGIMTSFQSIAASRNTSLAVVAPGIAEALLATAMGLFAAIPGADRLQQIARRRRQGAGAHGKLRRRVLVHPVAADRPASASGDQARPRIHRLAKERADGAWQVGAGRGRKSGRRPSLGVPRRLWRDGGHQHDTVHRRHARALDHLHGGGAAVDERRRGRSAAGEGRRFRSTSNRSRSPSRSTIRGRSSSMDQPVADADVLDKLGELAKGRSGCAGLRLRASKIVPYGRRGADHGRSDLRRLQEGGARHRSGYDVDATETRPDLSERLGIQVGILRFPGALHCRAVGVSARRRLASQAPRFDDATESIPVDTITQTQFNEIMHGETGRCRRTDVAGAAAATQLPPAAAGSCDKAEPTPPEPPPGPAPRSADYAAATRSPRSLRGKARAGSALDRPAAAAAKQTAAFAATHAAGQAGAAEADGGGCARASGQNQKRREAAGKTEAGAAEGGRARQAARPGEDGGVIEGGSSKGDQTAAEARLTSMRSPS